MRRRLGDITLTDGRRTVRRAVFTGQVVLAALALLAVMVEEHHLPGRPWHSTWGEMAGAPLLIMVAVVIACAAALRWPRLDTGILAGAVTVVGSMLSLGFLVGVHILEQPDHNIGYGAAVLTLTSLAPLAVVAQIAEIATRVRERRHLEDSEPAFPMAIVVRR
ncbi:MAG: hypothetical protein JNL83_02795 [Myxococcales bacterium]|nr:hypothetical protein [Myxococcales bacterium]